MLQKENRYDIKKDLIEIHKKDRRDYSAQPLENEFVISDGIAIVLPEKYEAVVETAANDFADYMLTSMGMKSFVNGEGKNFIKLSYNKNIGEGSGYMGYRINVTDSGITVEGYDGEGLAQGLYFLEDLMNLRKAPFLEKRVWEKKALFSPRFVQSPFGMYEYTDECFAHMAHLGYDAIMLWIKGLNID